MTVSVDDITCPKCGHYMAPVPYSDWSLNDIRAVTFICENCLHIERREYILIDVMEGSNDATAVLPGTATQ